MSGAFTLWRVAADTPSYEADDLSGKGAELSGGRWNLAGTPMLYTSTSRALACLETVVHLADNPLPLNRYLVRIEVSAELWATANVLDLAALIGWDAEPAGRASMQWGSAWARTHASSSLLAVVPSIVVPEEMNVLINPAHRDLGQLKATKVRKWLYDRRLKD